MMCGGRRAGQEDEHGTGLCQRNALLMLGVDGRFPFALGCCTSYIAAVFSG